MEEILAKVNANDTAVIREGTVQLKEALKNPEALPALCQIMQTSQKPQIRQTAALILKKRFGKIKYWSALPINVQEGIKDALLKALITEPEKFVKNSVTHAIGVIVELEDKCKKAWPDLSHFLQKFTTSENQNEKELGFYALSILTATAPNQFMQHVGSFSILFNSALSNTKDHGSTVAYYAIMCLTNFIHVMDEKKELKNIYAEILPKVIMSITALSTKRADRANEAMDLLYELADCKASDLLNPRMKQIINMCLDFIREPSIKTDVQIKAFGLLSILIQSNMKIIIKLDLLVPILHVVLKIMCEKPEDDDGEEDYFSSDPDDDTLLTSACECLDDIALNTEAELLIPHINDFIDRGLKGTDPYIHKACYLSLGIVAQGTEEYIKENCLAQFVKIVVKGVTVDKAVVRNAALFALGQFTDYLQPEVNQFAGEIMPLLLLLLGELEKRGTDSNLRNTADRIFFPLEKFLENIEESIESILSHLVGKLITLSRPPYENHLRELAIEALGTTANCVKEGIVPYFSSIMDLVLNPYISAPVTAETANLQVEAIDTLGNLIRNINMETFEPIADNITKIGLSLLQNTEDPDIRKACYGLFAAMSAVLKERIAPLLPTVMDFIVTSIKSQEGTVTVEKEDEDDSALNVYESEDEEEEDDDDDDEIEIENDFVEEKEESCLALKELAENAGESFFPFLELSYVEVMKLLDFPAEDVKNAAASACFQFAISFTNINTPEGQQAACQVITNLISKCCIMVRCDDDREVVMNLLECFQNFLEQIGSKVDTQCKENILSCVKDILQKKTECQNDEEEEEYDDGLIDTALDVIPCLGKSVTPDQFSNYFTVFIPLLKDRMDESADDSTKRSNLMGSLAECLAPLGLYVSTHMAPFLPYILCMTKDPDTLVRNNSVYFLGEFALHGKETAVSNYPDILNALSAVLSSEKNPKVLDNICGSLAKLILSNPGAVPLDTVVPVLLENLPLKEDFVEDKWIFRAISSLYQLGDKGVLRFIVHIIKCAADSMHSHSPDDETKEILSNLIKMCYRDFPNDFNTAASQLPEELISLLQQICAT